MCVCVRIEYRVRSHVHTQQHSHKKSQRAVVENVCVVRVPAFIENSTHTHRLRITHIHLKDKSSTRYQNTRARLTRAQSIETRVGERVEYGRNVCVRTHARTPSPTTPKPDQYVYYSRYSMACINKYVASVFMQDRARYVGEFLKIKSAH